MEESVPFTSVIIPVYNDAQRLRICLEALGAQSYPADRWEVIVVDNGSQDDVRSVVESFGFCQFVEEQKPGSYAARNHGLESARGEVIAFTDADCIPDAHWLQEGVRALVDNPSCGFVGGDVVIFPADPRRPTAIELFDMLFGMQQPPKGTIIDHCATANLLSRREIFDCCGRFDDRVKSGADSEWGRRVTASGFLGVFAERAVVRHPARRRFSEVARQARRFAGGHFDRRQISDPYRYGRARFWHAVWLRLFPRFERMRVARERLPEMGYGKIDWLRVCFVSLALQYVTTLEFMRKWLGFTSERR